MLQTREIETEIENDRVRANLDPEWQQWKEEGQQRRIYRRRLYQLPSGTSVFPVQLSRLSCATSE